MTSSTTIHMEIIVEAPSEKAFRVFTAGFDTWWPRTHHIASVPMKEAVIEQKLGGRWYEKGEDGSECDWGKVIAWEPPKHFAVTWQLTHDYQYDPHLITEVHVTFESLDAHRTRVVFEHKYLDRYGDKMESVRNNIGNEESGWGRLLGVYAAVVEKENNGSSVG